MPISGGAAGLSLSEYYHHEATVAAGASFIPPARTIGMVIGSDQAIGAGDVEIRRAALVIKQSLAADKGFIGAIEFDGTLVRITNQCAGASDFFIYGVSIS